MLFLSMLSGIMGYCLNEDAAFKRIYTHLDYECASHFLRSKKSSIGLVILFIFTAWGKGMLMGNLLQRLCPQAWGIPAGIYLLCNLYASRRQYKMVYTSWLALAGLMMSYFSDLIRLPFALCIAVYLISQDVVFSFKLGRWALTLTACILLTLAPGMTFVMTFCACIIWAMQEPFLGRLIR